MAYIKKFIFQEKLIHILLSDFMQLYLKFCGLTAGIWQWHSVHCSTD